MVRTGAPALLPLLRSQVQGELLALLYLAPEREFTVSEAARYVEASFQSVHHEVVRLVAAGLVADRRQGNNRLVRAVTDSPISRPLTDLLAVTYGPLPVLTEALSALAGVQRAFIFGSWAARHAGEAGSPPRDVDVLVVGDVDQDDLHDLARAAETRLHREVNPRRVRPAAWEDTDDPDPFLTTLRTRPLLELHLSTATTDG